MSDLEKVARKIASALGDNLDDAFANKSEWNAARGEKGGRLRDINEPFRDDYLQAARAAVEALREPSEGMVAAAHASMVRENCGYEYSVTLGHRAMIDHILKEG